MIKNSRGRSIWSSPIVVAFAAIAILVPASAHSETLEEKGRAIAEEADKRNRGWVDSLAKARMILRDRQGAASERAIEIRSLEAKPDNQSGGKGLLIFEFPPDVRGTILLTHSYKNRDDDQWIYLPEIKRIRRISSSNKSGSFVGSEFAYEDMRAPQIDKYNFRYLSDERCGTLKCFVIERIPKDADSGYSRQLVLIDQAEYRTHKMDYYDRANSRIKTLTLDDHRQHLGRFWRPYRMSMLNHRTGRSTDLIWSEYRFQQKLSEREFDRESLSWIH